MKNLDDYINNITQSKTADEAFKHFSASILPHGYDRIIYSLITDHASFELPTKHGLISSYPEDWLKHYTQNTFTDLDPVIQYGTKTTTPFYWDDIEKFSGIADEHNILNMGKEAGLYNGIAVTSHNAPGEVSGIGFARSVNEKKRDTTFLASAYLLSSILHERLQFLYSKKKKKIISQREKDVLCWAAEGKTNYEIGVILGISENTVKTHWKNINLKLNVCNKVQAVSRAINFGLITPQDILKSSPNRVIYSSL